MGPSQGPPSPPTLGAPRQSRGAPREYTDGLLEPAFLDTPRGACYSGHTL
jgi:hypothetical protein